MTIYFMRIIRLADFFTELQQFSLILGTLKKFSLPFLSMMVNLYTVFFTYAFIGQVMWGGRVTTSSVQVTDPEIPGLYYLMNFNDFGASLVTLFHIMVVNNWWITCNMFIDIDCGFPVENCPLKLRSQLFFVSFWILTVLIIFNLIISNVIEIYDSVEEEVYNNFARRKYAKELSQMDPVELRRLV